MSVSDVSATASSSSQHASTTASRRLGKDDFLKLLVAQLKAQNPLSPMQNTEFIAQMAQFSALEQLQNLNSRFSQLVSLQQNHSGDQSLLFAVNLLGKQADATDPRTNHTYSGKVQNYWIRDHEVWFTVGGMEVPSAWISGASIADTETSLYDGVTDVNASRETSGASIANTEAG